MKFMNKYPTVVRWSTSSKGVGLVALFFFLYFSLSSINYHQTDRYAHGKHDLGSDAAGYYIYLPGVFHYHMRGTAISAEVLRVSGQGFSVDVERDKILTKYTCGAAILEFPFFLVGHALAGADETDAWGPSFHKAIEVGGIFYFTLGLVLIYLTLRRWRLASVGLLLLCIACVAFGTNTFFYAFVEPGFSHVYSFFLVALSLYLAVRSREHGLKGSALWAFAISNALIILIRPLDMIAVLAVYALIFIDNRNVLGSVRLWLVQTVTALIVALPQMLYWKYAFDKWIVYSYGDEGFIYWASPKLAEVLASPFNGLLPHAPVFILLPLALVVMYRQKRPTALLFTILFALIIYSCASWHSWHFGCAYGMRPLVQYTPFLAICLLVLFAWAKEHKPHILNGAVSILLLLCFINFRYMMYREPCYPGGYWDWKYYGRELAETFFGSLPTDQYR